MALFDIESLCWGAVYSSIGDDKEENEVEEAGSWVFTLVTVVLVANFAKTKLCKKLEKLLKPWHMGTHLRVLSDFIL